MAAAAAAAEAAIFLQIFSLQFFFALAMVQQGQAVLAGSVVVMEVLILLAPAGLELPATFNASNSKILRRLIALAIWTGDLPIL